MTNGARHTPITFDTNLAGVWRPRVFWATLCEDIGQRMELTPTTVAEVLRRIRLETEREWTKKLRAINQSGGHRWSKIEIRRLATTASTAARDWFRDELRRQGSIYASTSRPAEEVEALEAEIDETIDDRAFDLSTDNGVRDRKIVIEAMARGYDILASNNVGSIVHEILKEWIERGEGKELGVRTTILRPEPAERRLRRRYDKPLEWTAVAAARACVTDAADPHRAARELADLIDGFHQRGMGDLKEQIYRLTETEADLQRILDAVLAHGNSLAMRSERELSHAASQAVSRRTGVDIGS